MAPNSTMVVNNVRDRFQHARRAAAGVGLSTTKSNNNATMATNSRRKKKASGKKVDVDGIAVASSFHEDLHHHQQYQQHNDPREMKKRMKSSRHRKKKNIAVGTSDDEMRVASISSGGGRRRHANNQKPRGAQLAVSFEDEQLGGNHRGGRRSDTKGSKNHQVDSAPEDGFASAGSQKTRNGGRSNLFVSRNGSGGGSISSGPSGVLYNGNDEHDTVSSMMRDHFSSSSPTSMRTSKLQAGARSRGKKDGARDNEEDDGEVHRQGEEETNTDPKCGNILCYHHQYDDDDFDGDDDDGNSTVRSTESETTLKTTKTATTAATGTTDVLTTATTYSYMQGQKPPSGVINVIVYEIRGFIDDTKRSVNQVLGAFTLGEDDIRAVTNRIDRATKEIEAL